MNILARLRMLFLLLAAFLVASCAREAIPLNGTVTDAYTGQPIVAASISLGSQNLTTDSSGAFSIKRWTTKDVLQVQANGYEPTSIELS
ncbi:MAG TPA: carboxypeptidase regulatory-like domain-containing protein, partial [Roseiflexaceae bacterium]|nr:carboxypeptidase regulatory-like domain-containing protein [Roseiflexaceae bacterium]